MIWWQWLFKQSLLRCSICSEHVRMRKLLLMNMDDNFEWICRDQPDSLSRPFSWSRSWSQKYSFSWSRSQSRIYVNKTLGLACWDCTCSVSVSVSNLKNWSLVYKSYSRSARVSVSTIFPVRSQSQKYIFSRLRPRPGKWSRLKLLLIFL